MGTLLERSLEILRFVRRIHRIDRQLPHFLRRRDVQILKYAGLI